MKKYNVEFFAEGLNQEQNDELFALLKKFSDNGAFVSGSRDSNPKEPETVHGNEAGKGGIQKKFCEVCGQETYHDSYGCLGTSFG